MCATINSSLRFSQLSPPRQALVRLCQTIDYGHIQGLEVKDSDPFLNPPPVVMVDLNLDGPEGERPEAELPDFVIRHEISRLMDRLDEMKNGTVERIEVRAGIPRRIVFRARLGHSVS